jgi:hypothetical protein
VRLTTSTDNVGIGTATPGGKFEVESSSANVIIDGRAGGTSARQGTLQIRGVRTADSTPFAATDFYQYDGVSADFVGARIAAHRDLAQTSSKLVFWRTVD